MSTSADKLPSGNSSASGVVSTARQMGEVVRQRRRELDMRQIDIAGVGNTGNRFVVDLENGKPTVQLQKVLDLLDLLGLEVVVRPKNRGIV